MALKVGDLYVSLTANTQKLQGQLNSAAKQVEKFGRQMKSLGRDASEMSNVVVAAMAAVFAAASSKDAKNLEVKKQLEDLKTQSVALASEIAQAAMPVIQQMTDFVGRLITAFQQMTPAQKEILVSFLQGAMAVSALGVAAVKLEPAFKLGASAISFAGTAMSGLGTAVVWVQGRSPRWGLASCRCSRASRRSCLLRALFAKHGRRTSEAFKRSSRPSGGGFPRRPARLESF